MTERCVSCRHTAECARVLCTPDAEPVLAGFCPNVGHFRTLASRLRDGSIFVAPATEDRLTWPEREAAWDHRCDSPSDS
jgi:hypothetical protein